MGVVTRGKRNVVESAQHYECVHVRVCVCVVEMQMAIAVDARPVLVRMREHRPACGRDECFIRYADSTDQDE